MPTSTSLVDLANAGVRQLMQVAFAPDGEVVCEDGVFECGNPSYEKALRSDPDLPCTEYDGEYKEIEGKAWPLIVAAIVGAVMCFMIGANDSANSWGSSVGSKALPVGVAVVLGGIMEWLGALSLGYGVSSTIRKGVAKPSDPECWACGYCNSRMGLYSIAMLSALIAAAIFMSITTFTAVPVSTTHAIVGGVVGSTIVAVGWDCLNWDWDGGLTGIIASWAISPLGSGMVGATAYLVLDYGLLRTPDARFSSFFWNPVLYFITTFIVLMLVLLKSKPTKKALERWEMSLISLGAGIAVAAIDVFFIMPIVKKHFPSVTAAKAKDAEKGGAEDTAHDGGEEGAEERVFDRVASVVGNNEIALHGFGDSKVLGEALEQRTKELAEESAGWSVEVKDAMYTFRPLLVFVAMVESFAHGANDTANSTSAVTAVWQMYDSGRRNCNIKETPVWLMAIAGGFVALGIITFGYRVIKTIGLNITSINFMKGFCIEFASTLSVVVFTVLEIPVSTTHCQVGAVVFVGLVSLGPKHVAWWLFGKIVLSWVLTLPFAGGIAAAFTAMLRPALKD